MKRLGFVLSIRSNTVWAGLGISIGIAGTVAFTNIPPVLDKPEVEPPCPHAQQSAVYASSGLLTTILPLFPGRLQLPVSLRVDLLPAPGEHVLRVV